MLYGSFPFFVEGKSNFEGNMLTFNTILAQLKINPYSTNGFFHHYQLDESTFIFRGVRSDFYFSSDFSMKFLCANRIAPDGTPRSCGVTSGAILFAYVL